MGCLRRIGRIGKIAFGALAVWLTLHGFALAQMPRPNKPAEQSTTAYVLSYFLVILGIAAGLLFVCRPSGRRDRARPEQYEETNYAADDDKEKAKKKKKK